MGESLERRDSLCAEHLFPPAECAEEEVVQTAHQTCHQQWLGLAAALLTADKHLCGGSGFREWEFAVHVLYEILTERNEEQNAEQTAEE